ncbi:hypothetical protein AB4Z42_06710 [Mycobacterium sp. 2YAF39]|uniref:hypothetical protein n=1 Tax=Mycobacterium sp. 2YAF39 TaxID=3233033 RepID=UPI003F95283A
MTLIAAYLGLFVGLIDANAMNLALPAIRDDLGGGISGAHWTEHRHHLSGALGRALFDRFLSAGWIKRMPRGRALAVTDDGRTALADAFAIDWSAVESGVNGRR